MVGKWTILFALMLGLYGCTGLDDDFGPQSDRDDRVQVTGRRVLILNEGNFMFGNGSLSEYDADSKTVNNEVYASANGMPLGDIPQSMVYTDSCLLVVVNNSNKVVGADPNTYEHRWELSGIYSPRYMAQTDAGDWLITSLFSNKIYRVNFSEGQVRAIDHMGWNEKIIAFEDGFIIENMTSNSLEFFDPVNETFETIYVSDTTWVDLDPLHTGVALAANNHQVVSIRKTNNGWKADTVLDIPAEHQLQGVAVNPINSKLVVAVTDGLYQGLLNESGLLSAPLTLLAEPNFTPYNIALSTQDEIYLTDPRSFVGIGRMVVYNMEGYVKSEVELGIIPQEITFAPKR